MLEYPYYSKEKYYGKEYKALNVKLHDEVVFYQDYAKSLLELYGTGNKKDKKKKAPDVSVDNLLGLMSKNKKIRERDMMGKTGITWKSEPRSRQAMQKFTNMMLKNDYKKMQYAATLLKQGELKNGLKLNDVMNLPLPLVEKPMLVTESNLKDAFDPLMERLKKLDDNLHVNSSEFKKMKAVMRAMDKHLKKDTMNRDLLGKQVEALQKATMEYIKAKGVGEQKTEFGQDRMDFALDVCQMAADQMDFVASPERKKQISEFEQKAFGKVISQEGVLNFRMMEYDLEKYNTQNAPETVKNTTENVKEKEIDDPELELRGRY